MISTLSMRVLCQVHNEARNDRLLTAYWGRWGWQMRARATRRDDCYWDLCHTHTNISIIVVVSSMSKKLKPHLTSFSERHYSPDGVSTTFSSSRRGNVEPAASDVIVYKCTADSSVILTPQTTLFQESVPCTKSNLIKLCPRRAQTCALPFFCCRDLDLGPMTLKLNRDIGICLSRRISAPKTKLLGQAVHEL